MTCKNELGPLSVFNQHHHHFLSKQIDACPWELMMMQLHQQILEWQDGDDFLIVGGDWNQDIREESWKQFWQDLDLVTPQALADSPTLSTYS